jgi:hypothetical protein
MDAYFWEDIGVIFLAVFLPLGIFAYAILHAVFTDKSDKDKYNAGDFLDSV